MFLTFGMRAGVKVDSRHNENDVVASETGLPIFRAEQSAWGAVVSFERRGSQSSDEGLEVSTSGRNKEPQWMIDVLVNCHPKSQQGDTLRK